MRETVDEPTNRTKVHRWGLDGDGAVVLSVYSSRSAAVCLRLAALNVLRSFEEETQLLSPSWSSVLVGDDLLALTPSKKELLFDPTSNHLTQGVSSPENHAGPGPDTGQLRRPWRVDIRRRRGERARRGHQRGLHLGERMALSFCGYDPKRRAWLRVLQRGVSD